MLLPPLQGWSPALELLITEVARKTQLVNVAIDVSGCWWSDRDAREPNVSWLRRELIEWVNGESGSALPPAVVGFEAGGQGALRLAYRFPDEFPVVAAIRPAIDYHRCLQGEAPTPTHEQTVRKLYGDAESARQDTATLHIHPLNWPRHQWFACGPNDRWWDGADRLRMKLQSLGVMHECDLESDAARESDYDAKTLAAAVDFVADRLGVERRRVQ